MVRRIRNRIGQSLRLRFALSIAALVAVVGGAVSLVGTRLLEDALVEAHGDSTERIARQVAAQQASGRQADMVTLLREVVEQSEGVVAAALYASRSDGPGWTRIASFGEAGVPVILTGSPLDERRRVQRTTEGAELIVVTVPVDDAGLYAVRVSRSLDEVDAVEDRAQALLLALATILVALGTLFGDRLCRTFVAPLLEMMAAMRDVTNGRFGRRLDTTNRDELGVLARRFNMMARAIERHRNEAEQYADELEHRVSARTAELERANLALRSLDRAKDAFLSNVSHEMRTPLTSILASIEILRSFGSDDPEERREFLSIVDAESKRLLGLIDRVLEIVALEAAPLELRPNDEGLEGVIETAVARVQERAAARQVTILRHGAISIAQVSCDRERIADVLDGLLDNAIKFSPQGGTIELTVETETHGVQIRIRDEGPGLSQADVEGIFAKFVQLGATLTDKPRGFGLGLPLARRVAEAHGGTIRCEHEPGFGATFVLVLPIVVESTASPEPRTAEHHHQDLHALMR